MVNNVQDATVTIVYVDTDTVSTSIFKILLRKIENISSETFLDPHDAIDHMRSKRYDEDHQKGKQVLIVDLFLPDLTDGLHFFEMFDALPPEIKGQYAVFAAEHTGHDDDVQKIKQVISKYAFIDQFLLKQPFTVEILNEALSKAR